MGFNNLKEINIPTAKALAQHQGVLALNGVNDFDEGLALLMATSKAKTLQLRGLQSMDDRIITSLSNSLQEPTPKNSISLLNLRGLTQTQISFLQKLKPQQLFFEKLDETSLQDVIQAFPNTYLSLKGNNYSRPDSTTCSLLKNHKGGFHLSGITKPNKNFNDLVANYQ